MRTKVDRCRWLLMSAAVTGKGFLCKFDEVIVATCYAASNVRYREHKERIYIVERNVSYRDSLFAK